MIWLRTIFFAVFTALCLCVCAQAEEDLTETHAIKTARQAFTAGAYIQAEALLNTTVTVEGLTLRAEIMSARVMLGLTKNPHKLAGSARKLTERALTLDPDNIETKIQYALAHGFEARSAGIVKAWRKKLPQKCKAAIDAAYVAAPDDARTSALLGAWHLGLVRKAGERRARKMFGASLSEGMSYYDSAVKRDPENIVILGNYAISLLGIDAQRHHEKAFGLITDLEAAPARNATDVNVQMRMKVLLPFLQAQDFDGLSQAVEQTMNDPNEDSEQYSHYE